MNKRKRFLRLALVLSVLVGILTVWGKASRHQNPPLTSALVGEKLSDIFVNSWKSPDDIKKIKNNFSIIATNTEIYLCLSSLYFMSFIRATQSKDIQLSPTVIEKISHNLASFLVVKYVNFHRVNEDPEVLLQKQNRITQSLIETWDESIDKKPSPHWYVGKEVCYLLNARHKTPDPALVGMFASFMSNDTILIKQLLDELEEKFTIVE